MSWQTPLVNRKAADIANGTWRSYINASDLNRIGGNIAFLNGIAGIGLTPKTDWQEGYLRLRASDVQALLDDAEALRIWFATQYPDMETGEWYWNLPDMPLTHFEQFNRLERLLLRLYRAWEGHTTVDEHASGEFFAGETIGEL